MFLGIILTAIRGTLTVAQLIALEQNSDDVSETAQDENITDSVQECLSRYFPQEHFLTKLPFHSKYRALFPYGAQFTTDANSNGSLFNPSATYIDLTPRPVMSTGPLIEALVRTNAGHYLDFRPLDALYQYFGSAGVQRVPASRSDVFQNRFVSAIEKRRLMRFIHWCIDEQRASSNSNSLTTEASSSLQLDNNLTFSEAMTKMEISDKLRDFIQTSILFSSSTKPLSVAEGQARICRFHDSLARFGTRTPFLVPNHGIAELPQALCRLSAVHGGTYVLRRSVACVVRDVASTHAIGIVTTEDDVVAAKHVFLARNLVSCASNSINSNLTWRFAGVVDGSIMRSDTPARFMLTFPRYSVGNDGSMVRMRQIDGSTSTCAQGLFLLYAETVDSGGCDNDLLACVRHLVDMSEVNMSANEEHGLGNDSETTSTAAKKPNLLWSIIYSRDVDIAYGGERFGAEIVCPPDVEHDTDGVFEEAKRCFRTVFPDKPFLPDLRREMNTESNDSDAELTNSITQTTRE